MRTIALLTLAALPLVLPACVELDGQRITIRYLAERDELQLLLCYDGIHSSDPEKIPEAENQFEEFVEGGDFMILDWPFHFEMKQFRESLEKEEGLSPAERAAARALVTSTHTTVLGHYRDADGRIGAAQLVTISKASELLAAVNAIISEQVLSGDVDDDWKWTAAKMLEGAKKGEQWFRFEGHSIVGSIPVHLPEWQRNKGEFFENLFDEQREREDDDEASGAFYVQLLAAAPMSLLETPNRVTLRLGAAARPTTFRFRLRETEKAGLDEAVVKLVPRSLDRRIAANLLLGGEGEADPALETLLEIGPPEEKVRALLSAARDDDVDLAARAEQELATFARRWNREVGVPEAPSGGLAEWEEWYRRVVRFPAED